MPVAHIPSSYTHLLVVIAVLFLVNLSSFSMCVIASVSSVSYFSFFNIKGTGSYTLFCILSFNKVSRIFLCHYMVSSLFFVSLYSVVRMCPDLVNWFM